MKRAQLCPFGFKSVTLREKETDLRVYREV